jgi:psp operon transcriptional activator
MAEQRIIGSSGAWLESLDQVSRLAAINRPVLVLGERGTGKELIAERLHFLSGRWDQPLIKVNCASFSDELLESELFGHEAGAFTGANRTHIGRFERAQGGTLLLDELATMNLRVQEKILRVIEYGEFERLGGRQTLTTDVRIVGATNGDLKALAKQEKFREDLLDRLAFDVIRLPPLRQRLGDITELADHFAVRISHELGWPLFPGFSDHALQTLETHTWPGNVRELKNAVERSVYRWDNPHDPIDIIVVDPFGPDTTVETEKQPKAASEPKDQTEKTTKEKTQETFQEAVENYQRQLLTKALEDNQFHQGNTAKSLGLSYDQLRGLYRKFKLSA